MPTFAEVLAEINANIVPNGNNEITADVLRPILEAMLQQPNELIGDMTELTTAETDTLVDAINSITAGFDQNNVPKMFTFTSTADDTEPVTETDAANIVNAAAGGYIISETDTPVLITVFKGENKYIFIYKGGKGVMGGGASTAADFFLLVERRLTEADLDNDPDATIIPLGELPDGDYLTAANSETYDFSDSGTETETGVITYYFSYVEDSVLYFVLFVGEPGIYGSGETAFTEDDFVASTNSGVTPGAPIPTLQQVAESGNNSNIPITITGLTGKTDYLHNGKRFTDGDGNTVTIEQELPIVPEVTYTVPAKAADDTFAMVSDIETAIEELPVAQSNIYPIVGTVRCFEVSTGVYEWQIVESDGSGGGQVHYPINVASITTPTGYEGRVNYDEVDAVGSINFTPDEDYALYGLSAVGASITQTEATFRVGKTGMAIDVERNSGTWSVIAGDVVQPSDFAFLFNGTTGELRVTASSYPFQTGNDYVSVSPRNGSTLTPVFVSKTATQVYIKFLDSSGVQVMTASDEMDFSLFRSGSWRVPNKVLANLNGNFWFVGLHQKAGYAGWAIDTPIDSTPTDGSTNLVTSGGVYTAIEDSVTEANNYTDDAISNLNLSPQLKVDSYILALSDTGKVIEIDSATDETVTVPADADVDFPIGSQVLVTRVGTGEVEIVGGSGVSLRQSDGFYRINTQWDVIAMYKRAANEWVLSGKFKV